MRDRVKDALSTLIAREVNSGGWPSAQAITIVEGQPLRICKQFVDYASEGYGGNPWIYRAVRKIVDTSSEIEWDVMRNVASGDQEDVDNSPLEERWKNPNPSSSKQSQHDFLETIILHLELAGNCFVYRAKPNNELSILRPDLVDIIPGPNRTIARYEYKPDPQKPPQKFNADEVLHIMFVDPVNELDGVAPAEAAARSIDLNNISRQWNFAKLQNTVGLSHVFLTGDQPFSENQIEQVKNVIDEQYVGPSNAGKMAVVEANQIAPLSETAKDMDWSQIMDISAVEVSVAFGVPYVLLHPEGATYENLDHAKRQLFTETVFPLLDKIKDAFNGWLVPLYGDDLELTFDKENVSALQEDITSKAQWVLQLAINRIVDVNEARDLLGLENRDDCDIWLEPSNILSTPVGEQPEPPAPEPAAAPAAVLPPEQQLTRLISEIRRKYAGS
jgi:HK97 family phage portal protein